MAQSVLTRYPNHMAQEVMQLIPKQKLAAPGSSHVFDVTAPLVESYRLIQRSDLRNAEDALRAEQLFFRSASSNKKPVSVLSKYSEFAGAKQAMRHIDKCLAPIVKQLTKQGVDVHSKFGKYAC